MTLPPYVNACLRNIIRGAKTAFSLENNTFFKQILALPPIRQHDLQQSVKLFGVIRIDKVAEFVHYDIFDTVFRCFDQSAVQRNRAFVLLTAAPAGYHVPDSQLIISCIRFRYSASLIIICLYSSSASLIFFENVS